MGPPGSRMWGSLQIWGTVTARPRNVSVSTSQSVLWEHGYHTEYLILLLTSLAIPVGPFVTVVQVRYPT